MKSKISIRSLQVPFFVFLILTFIFKVKVLEFYLFCKYLINGESVCVRDRETERERERERERESKKNYCYQIGSKEQDHCNCFAP